MQPLPSIATIAALAVAAAAAGCATGPRTEPMVSTVCLEMPGMPAAELEFVRKRAGTYLAEYGYTLAAGEPCEATTKFQQLGQFQGEVLPGLFRAGSGYWSMEGMVSVTRAGRADLEDDAVDLRRYSTKQELLEALAWQTVRPITWLYQPRAKPSR